MSVALITALSLQFSSLALLRISLGRLWLRRPVVLIVLASVVYQGASAVLLGFPSIRESANVRIGIQQSYIDSATLLISACMLAFTIAYLVTGPQREIVTALAQDARRAASVLDWRWLALACLPLAVLTYTGRGYSNGVNMGAGTATGTKLAATFFIALVLLAAFSLVLREGPRWFLPALIAQSVLLAAAGERTPVAVDAIALIVMLAYAGLRPPSWQIRAALALTVVLILAITAVRAQQGRHVYYSDSGLGARVQALAGGVAGITSARGVVAQAANRFDGNAFAGGVGQALASGDHRLSSANIPESLLVLIPSSVWPAKLGHTAALNPCGEEVTAMGMQQVNFVPGFPGLYLGFLPPAGLAAFLAFCGLLAGWAERWLFRRCSAPRLVLLAGAVLAALRYEQGLPGMLVALRAAVVIAVVVKVAGLVRRRSVTQQDRLQQGRLDGIGRPQKRQISRDLGLVRQRPIGS